MPHLARHLPYEGTKVPALQTKADIDAMLHEFRILDKDKKKVIAEVKGIRWTDIPPLLPTLEFLVTYETVDGIRKTVGIRIQPPMTAKKIRKRGTYIIMNQPDQSMRIMYWYLKSKLESILYGLKDFSQEFLSDILVSLPNGNVETVGDIIIPQIKESKIPMLTVREEV